MGDADFYDYDLPEELIAQEPLARRDDARLLVVRRAEAAVEHRSVRDLPELLRSGDLVVTNDTRVVPARLIGRRVATGGRWEGLFLNVDRETGAWQMLAQTRGRPATGEWVMLADRDGRDAVRLQLVGRAAGGAWLGVPDTAEPVGVILERVGRVPIPGYIRGGEAQAGDLDRYQTVFARQEGSAAAPTAGLHFTPELFSALEARGIGRAHVTLHVGLDTFRPIAADRLEDHPMHSEWCECSAETAGAVRAAKARGGRIVAVGTTSVRTLETAALPRRALAGQCVDGDHAVSAWSGPTDLFIKPGFSFRTVDCLLTNFHMPRTTLMVLVSTFASRELIRRAYAEAIRERYRFLSYGDAMLIV